jgi:hypothetical protein
VRSFRIPPANASLAAFEKWNAWERWMSAGLLVGDIIKTRSAF